MGLHPREPEQPLSTTAGLTQPLPYPNLMQYQGITVKTETLAEVFQAHRH